MSASQPISNVWRVDNSATGIGRNPRVLTRPQQILSIGVVLLSLALLAAVWWSIHPTKSSCEVESRGVTGQEDGPATSVVDFKLKLADDLFWPAHYWQYHPNWAKAQASISGYLPGQLYTCWYNPLVRGHVSLSPRQLPATYAFWSFIAALLFVGGFGLSNLLSIIVTPTTPLPQHLPYRLTEEGGGPRSMLWFMAPMALFLVGVIYALVQVFIALWPLPSSDVHFFRVLSLVLMALAAAGTLGLLYLIGLYLYRLYVGSQTIVEISTLPLRPGETVQIHLSHRAGRLATESLEARLICVQTTRRYQRQRHHHKKQVVYHTDTRHNVVIGEKRGLHGQTVPYCEETFTFTVPDDAPATCQYDYPQIEWEIAVEVGIANGPEINLNYPVEIVRD